jgi:hypothetical protein
VLHKMLKAVAALAVALFGAVLVVQTPAQAAYADCQATRVCLFGSASYGGSPFQVTTGYIKTLPGNCMTLTASYNNWASSVVDKTSHIGGERIAFYDGSVGGTRLFVSTSTGLKSSGVFSDPGLATGSPVSNANDKVSSICVLFP